MAADRILAIDIGGGTQDILVYDPAQPAENSVQLVLPSPTVLVAGQIRRATTAGRAVFLTGELMGGGACVSALKRHIAAGLSAYATPAAALTVRDNPDEVRRRGVQIVDEVQDPSAAVIRTGDVDLALLRETLARYDVPLPERVAIAVQDHGECLVGQNRALRFRLWRDFILGGGALRDLAYVEPPAHFTRMRAVQRAAPGAIVMDTAAAAIWGALCDPAVATRREDGLIVVNVGNQHVVAALVRGDRVYGLCEHHTALVDRPKLQHLLRALYEGTISDEAVRADNGHGAAVHPEHHPWSRVPFVAVTGPRRALVSGLGYHLAAPYGNMMLSGAFGLAAAASGRDQLWPRS